MLYAPPTSLRGSGQLEGDCNIIFNDGVDLDDGKWHEQLIALLS